MPIQSQPTAIERIAKHYSKINPHPINFAKEPEILSQALEEVRRKLWTDPVSDSIKAVSVLAPIFLEQGHYRKKFGDCENYSPAGLYTQFLECVLDYVSKSVSLGEKSKQALLQSFQKTLPQAFKIIATQPEGGLAKRLVKANTRALGFFTVTFQSKDLEEQFRNGLQAWQEKKSWLRFLNKQTNIAMGVMVSSFREEMQNPQNAKNPYEGPLYLRLIGICRQVLTEAEVKEITEALQGDKTSVAINLQQAISGTLGQALTTPRSPASRPPVASRTTSAPAGPPPPAR